MKLRSRNKLSTERKSQSPTKQGKKLKEKKEPKSSLTADEIPCETSSKRRKLNKCSINVSKKFQYISCEVERKDDSSQDHISITDESTLKDVSSAQNHDKDPLETSKIWYQPFKEEAEESIIDVIKEEAELKTIDDAISEEDPSPLNTSPQIRLGAAECSPESRPSDKLNETTPMCTEGWSSFNKSPSVITNSFMVINNLAADISTSRVISTSQALLQKDSEEAKKRQENIQNSIIPLNMTQVNQMNSVTNANLFSFLPVLTYHPPLSEVLNNHNGSSGVIQYSQRTDSALSQNSLDHMSITNQETFSPKVLQTFTFQETNKTCLSSEKKNEIIKKFYCKYCKMSVNNFISHMLSNHKNNERVKRYITLMKANNDRSFELKQQIILELKSEADEAFKHDVLAESTSSNDSYPLNIQPYTNSNLIHDELIKCISCEGLFSKYSFHNHIKICSDLVKPEDESKSDEDACKSDTSLIEETELTFVNEYPIRNNSDQVDYSEQNDGNNQPCFIENKSDFSEKKSLKGDCILGIESDFLRNSLPSKQFESSNNSKQNLVLSNKIDKYFMNNDGVSCIEEDPVSSTAAIEELQNSTLVEKISSKQINKRDKMKNYCIYCKNLVTDFCKHMFSRHKNEKPVLRCLVMKQNNLLGKSAVKLKVHKILSKVRSKGNFIYSQHILKINGLRSMANSQVLSSRMPLKNKRKTVAYNNFVKCKFCKVLFSKTSYRRHAGKCTQTGTIEFTNSKGKSIKQNRLDVVKHVTCVTGDHIDTYNNPLHGICSNLDESHQTEQQIVPYGEKTLDQESNINVFRSNTPMPTNHVLENKFMEHSVNEKDITIKATTSSFTENSSLDGHSLADDVVVEEKRLSVNEESTSSCFSDCNSNDKVDEKIKPKKSKYRRNYCMYCLSLVTNLTRHIFRKHKNEEVVQRYLIMKKSNLPDKKTTLKNIMSEIRSKGNFIYNQRILKNSFLGLSNVSQLLPNRRPSKNSTANLSHKDYVTCKFCLNLLKKTSFSKHFQKCVKLSKHTIYSSNKSIHDTSLDIDKNCTNISESYNKDHGMISSTLSVVDNNLINHPGSGKSISDNNSQIYDKSLGNSLSSNKQEDSVDKLKNGNNMTDLRLSELNVLIKYFILPFINEPKAAQTALQDSLLLSLTLNYLLRSGFGKDSNVYDIALKLLSAGKLLVNVQEIDSTITEFKDCLTIEKLPLILNTIKNMCGYNETFRQFENVEMLEILCSIIDDAVSELTKVIYSNNNVKQKKEINQNLMEFSKIKNAKLNSQLLSSEKIHSEARDFKSDSVTNCCISQICLNSNKNAIEPNKAVGLENLLHDQTANKIRKNVTTQKITCSQKSKSRYLSKNKKLTIKKILQYNQPNQFKRDKILNSRNNYCMFCKRLINNFRRHVINQHEGKDIFYCQAFMKLKNKKNNLSKFSIIENLRRKGNYYYYYFILKNCSKKNSAFSRIYSGFPKYFSNKKAKDLYNPVHLRRNLKTTNHDSNSKKKKSIKDELKICKKNMHVKRCANYIKAYGFQFQPLIPKISDLKEKLSFLKVDDVSQVALNDPLLLSAINKFVHNDTNEKRNRSTAVKVRDGGRLLLSIRKRDNLVTGFKQCLSPLKIDVVFEAVKELCEFNKNTSRVQISSMPSRLSWIINEIAYQEMNQAMSDKSLSEKVKYSIIKDVTRFIDLKNLKFKTLLPPLKSLGSEIPISTEKMSSKYQKYSLDQNSSFVLDSSNKNSLQDRNKEINSEEMSFCIGEKKLNTIKQYAIDYSLGPEELLIPEVSVKLKQCIISVLKKDEITRTALWDPLLMEVISDYYENYSSKNKYTISKKIRDGGKLLMCIQGKDSSIKQFKDCINPSKVFIVLEAVKDICGLNETTGDINVINMPLRLSWIINRLASQIIKDASCDTSLSDSEKASIKKNIDEFLVLKQKKWTDTVGKYWTLGKKKKFSSSDDRIYSEDEELSLSGNVLNREVTENTQRRRRFTQRESVELSSEEQSKDSKQNKVFTHQLKNSNNEDTSDDESPNSNKIVHKKKRWCDAEKRTVICEFKDCIINKRTPGRVRCRELIASSDVLAHRTVDQLNLYIHNIISGKLKLSPEFQHLLNKPCND